MLALAPVTTAPANHYFLNLSPDRLIGCDVIGKPVTRYGTAFRIAKDIVVTANHVTADTPVCHDSLNRPEVPYVRDGKNDISLVATIPLPTARVLKYSCSGFKPGSVYFSIGYADGTDLVIEPMMATPLLTDWEMTKAVPDGFRLLLGNLYHGMSGGPVVDMEGTVVGINNGTDGQGHALSRELKQTALCGRE